MNLQFSPALEQRLMRVAMDAGHDACDPKPFQCFKCHKGCEDWEGDECETCGEFFCDECLVEPVQAMAPECCHSCAYEAASMEETYRTLQRPD